MNTQVGQLSLATDGNVGQSFYAQFSPAISPIHTKPGSCS